MNYNPESKNSFDLYLCVKDICEEISEDLKTKTIDYMSENQNYFYDLEDEIESTEIKEEYFLLQIKLNEEVFISRIFPAYVFHPKVRYTVDIRPKLKRILSDLTDILSAEELEMNYLNYQL